MSLWRLYAFALVSGLVACGHTERPTTPTFTSQLPPLQSGFGELNDRGPTVDACADLVAAATMQSSETVDGAVIELTPRTGREAVDVEAAATRVEQTFLPGVTDVERASCRIFDPEAEVNVHLSNEVSGMRLVFETFDRRKIPEVRARVKAFAADHGH